MTRASGRVIAVGAPSRAIISNRVERGPYRRHWRFYETATGNRPVAAFLDALSAVDAAEVVAAMKDVAAYGLGAARHLRGDVWEVRVDGENQTYRVLFSAEGRFHHVLLALEAFSKKTQKIPTNTLQAAERRLADWRMRGKHREK